jgi:hypothetical protein
LNYDELEQEIGTFQNHKSEKKADKSAPPAAAYFYSLSNGTQSGPPIGVRPLERWMILALKW